MSTVNLKVHVDQPGRITCQKTLALRKLSDKMEQTTFATRDFIMLRISPQIVMHQAHKIVPRKSIQIAII